MKLKDEDIRFFDVATGKLAVMRLYVDMKKYPKLDAYFPKLGKKIFDAFGKNLAYNFGYTNLRTPCLKIWASPEMFKGKDVLAKFQFLQDYMDGELADA